MNLEEWRDWWRKRGNAGIRRILMAEWDPIGIKDFPEAADEYDSYALRIARMLREGFAAAEIATYLSGAESEWMGFSQTPKTRAHCAAIAEELVRWYEAEVTAADSTHA